MANQKINKEKLFAYRARHPDMSMSAIARVFHVSKQRVCIIFKVFQEPNVNVKTDNFHIGN